MSCHNSVVVQASADEVWNVLRDFLDMSWAPEVIEQCEPQGGLPGTQIGAKRILNGTFQETLVGLDDHARTLRYSIDDGPDAVSKDNVQGYIATVQVLPITDTGESLVLWTSSWEWSGGGVAQFCNPIYQALLGQLQKHFR
ncbi:SRPBCC family protein [Thiohalorhabdus methylotrophus]|uniref:SRPBCC family protein n=1 Tax=Thiohalorhabdus methylotrophus TaxID=3242694 RepID=A0ABV4TQA2_9GAMM